MYNIERVIRNFDGKEKEIKFLSGLGNLTADIIAREVTLQNKQNIFVAGGYGQSIAFDYWEKGEKKVLYFPIEVWGKTAETLGALGRKGTEISVTGRLEKRSYTNQAKQTNTIETLVIEMFRVTSRARTVASARN